jgi:hypothetical protein
MPDFTTEDMLLYLYNELTDKQKIAMEQAMKKDWALREKFQVLKEALQKLNNASLLTPRKQTVQAIMAYAKAKNKVPH